MSQENVEVVRKRLEGRWKRDNFEPVDYIDAGGAFVMVVARFALEWRDPPRVWLVFRVEAGEIADWHSYPSEQAARDAAGLSEQDAHADS